nr:UDP-3-O-(3-hydroxymyristoyl)glucosamine N-acyltransferase [Calidifontimicrobium sp. SYSU G02091]
MGEIVAALGGELTGDPQQCVTRIGPLASADRSTLSFLANPRYRAQLASTQAGCVIVSPEVRGEARTATIATADPYLYFARLTQWWARRTRVPAAAGVHPTAVVEEGAQVHPDASVGALAFVGRGARVEAGAVVGAQCHVGAGAVIGEGTRLAPRVVVGEGCRLGARCIVQPGAVIGGDGFGFAPHEGRWEKIEQLGAVRIGDDVEIGANTCIDRGALDDTVIEDGVKLDNLIQIAHNVRIGAHTAMAGCVGIAGSATIGAHCTIGGAAMIAGHLEIADHVHVSAGSFVSRSIRQPGHYTGVFPLDDNASWEKNAATLRQLHRLRERVRELEKKTG